MVHLSLNSFCRCSLILWSALSFFGPEPRFSSLDQRPAVLFRIRVWRTRISLGLKTRWLTADSLRLLWWLAASCTCGGSRPVSFSSSSSCCRSPWIMVEHQHEAWRCGPFGPFSYNWTFTSTAPVLFFNLLQGGLPSQIQWLNLS